MATPIILGFLIVVAVVVWAAVVTMSRCAANWVRVLYFFCFLAAGIAAYMTTFHWIYYANANTRFHGWPVPTVVFQRQDASAPWLDFVGPTIILAYPMNFLLYLLTPSIAILVLAHKYPSPTQPKGIGL